MRPYERRLATMRLECEFAEEVAANRRAETMLMLRGIAILVIVAILVIARSVVL